jgi:hypothetical protein
MVKKAIERRSKPPHIFFDIMDIMAIIFVSIFRELYG